jgi:predicted dienelactone hydrolase
LLISSVLLAVAAISTASADPPSFHADIARIAVKDRTPFDVAIAYPDVPVSSDARFPVVLFSHGGGSGPGTPLVHRDLLLHLAQQGFIVIAPFHPDAERPFVDRPRHIHMALDAVLADPRFARRADPDRIAMMGFSFGGAVTLIVAGASIDLAHLSAYCRDHPDDSRACDGIATDGSWAKVPPSPKSDDVLPLKALGSHFVFVDPCSPAMAVRAPKVCGDPPRTDRAAIHQRFKHEISDFLRERLSAAP